MNERLSVGGGGSGSGHTRIFKLASDISTLTGPAVKDAALREKIADWFVQAEGLKYTTYRTMTALSRGQTPGPESSIGKVVTATVMQDMANAALELEDQYGIINDPALAPGQPPSRLAQMAAPSMGVIAGGFDEDPAQHHRRANPRPAAGRPPRQGRRLQGHPDRAVGVRLVEGDRRAIVVRAMTVDTEQTDGSARAAMATPTRRSQGSACSWKPATPHRRAASAAPGR